MTQTFQQPDSSTQVGAPYKASLDKSVAVVAEVAAIFAAHENNPLALTVVVDAGKALVQGTLVTQNAQVVGGFVATGANQRIDRIVLDNVTLAASRVAGVESASPVAPAIPGGKLPCAVVGPFTTSTAQVTNNMITGERALLQGAPQKSPVDLERVNRRARHFAALNLV